MEIRSFSRSSFLSSLSLFILLILSSGSILAGTPSSLSQAVADRDMATVKQMLADGANPNDAGKDGATPLMKACEVGEMEIVKALLQAGADPLIQDKTGLTAFSYAACEDKPGVLQLLLKESGMSIGNQNNDEKSLSIIEILENALRIKTLENIHTALITALAEAHLHSGEKLAEQSANKAAIKEFNIALSMSPGLPIKGKASALNSLGEIYHEQGQYKKALGLFEQAGDIWNKASGENSSGYADSLECMASVIEDMGDYERALRLYNQSVEIRKNTSGTESLDYASVINDLALLYYYMGDYEKALPLYDKVLAILKSSPDGTEIYYATTLNNLALLYRKMGKNDKALTLNQEALATYKKAVGEKHPYYAIGLNNLALVYLNMGAYRKALPLYEQVIAIDGEVYGKDHPSYGMDLNNLAALYYSMGNHSEALSYYQKAADIFRRSLGEDTPIYSRILNNTANVYRDLGDNKKAMAVYKQSLEIKRKTLGEKHPDYATTLLTLSILYAQMADYEKALPLLKQAIPVLQDAGNPSVLGSATLEYASTLAEHGENQKALVKYKEGLDLLEKARNQAGITDLKKSFQLKTYPYFASAATFMLNNRYDQQAFEVVEAMKARGFLDQMAEGLANVEEGLDPELRKQRDRLVAKLSAIGKRQADAVAKNDTTSMEKLNKARIETESKMDALKVEIRNNNPRYASVRYPEPITLGRLQKETLRSDEVLIEYLLTDTEAWVFAVTNTQFKAVKLSSKPDQIRRSVRMFLHTASTRSDSTSTSSSIVQKISASLYSMLLAPIRNRIPSNSTLIVVPDGELAYLPFESLIVQGDSISGESVYLIERHTVKYFQSATVLALIRSETRGKLSRAYLGFGDPVYDYDNFEKKLPEKSNASDPAREVFKAPTRGEESEDEVLARLPGTGDEISRISSIFRRKGIAAKTELRENAREETAKSDMVRNYGYVHFACHGMLGKGIQGLALSRIPEAKDDGLLTLSEIMGLEWNARLTVLSACETGRGEMEKGEGVTSLTRAVMYAGSRAAVVSLWNVDDRATGRLMIDFYKGLIDKNLKPATALRRAKLKMLKSGKAREPFFWAPFVMYGE